MHTWRATSTQLVTTFKPRIESERKSITGLLFHSRGTLQTISFYCEVNNRLINHAKEPEGATVPDVLAISLFVIHLSTRASTVSQVGELADPNLLSGNTA